MTPAGSPKDLETIKREIAAIGSIAAPVAHDFNNILAAISGSATLLEIGSPNDASRHLNNIQNASQRGARILRQLQALSARSDADMLPFDFKAAVEETCHRLRETLSNYTLACAVQDGLPRITGDEAQIKLLVTILCDNARDAMPSGGPIIVSAATRTIGADQLANMSGDGRAGNFLVLRVEDAGRGIAPDVLPRIFEPFFTTKVKSKDAGTGLGLAIALRIMLRHGGWITARSDEGVSTTVECFFPIDGSASTAR